MNTPFGLCGDSPHEALVAVDRKTGTALANRAARELLHLEETLPLAALPARLAADPAEQEAIRTTLDTGKEARLASNPERISCRVLVHRTDDPDILLLHLKDIRELEMIKFQLSEYAEALITNFYHLEVANRSIGSVEKEKTSIVQAAIEVVAMTLEMSDRYTYGHSRRVSALACRIAEAGGFAPAELEILRRAALLHDIGKLGVISDILRKPAPLDDMERLIVEKHPQYGYDLLGNLPDFTAIAEIVYAHHEHWDGTGYPRRLSGAAIPLSATVISCADTFDAICTNRPYRPAHGIDYAYHEITANNGTQFNPQVVDWFLTVPREDFVRIEGQWQIS